MLRDPIGNGCSCLFSKGEGAICRQRDLCVSGYHLCEQNMCHPKMNCYWWVCFGLPCTAQETFQGHDSQPIKPEGWVVGLKELGVLRFPAPETTRLAPGSDQQSHPSVFGASGSNSVLLRLCYVVQGIQMGLYICPKWVYFYLLICRIQLAVFSVYSWHFAQ